MCPDHEVNTVGVSVKETEVVRTGSTVSVSVQYTEVLDQTLGGKKGK